MNSGQRHIAVCICTYKRAELLQRLLQELQCQRTEGLFTYSIVVADNDFAQSARSVVSAFAASAAIPVTYCVEPRQNIALVRNTALAHAHGDFIAFIDDDEYPSPNWLCELFRLCSANGVDGVVGPVIPSFEADPPQWALKGGFFEKRTRKTGCRIGNAEMRTSNVMIKRKILDGERAPFRAEFGTGNEDTDFFMRMSAQGALFVSCREAIVYETVPPARSTLAYLLRRALNRGHNSLKYRTGRVGRVIKSFVAVPAYCLALPFIRIAGEHHFIRYLMKICDHAGRLLALFRVNPFYEYK